MRLRIGLLIVATCAGTALAQDPPSRVARLNWISGMVSFQPAGVDTWAEATLNYPLTTGDHLYTDSGGRAELHIGANAIRIDHESNFGFLNLADRTVQMQFTEGSLEIRLRSIEDGEVYEVDTPNGAITLLQPGDYRIDTDPGRDATMVTVFRGQAEVDAGESTFPIRARETGFFPEGRRPDVRGANAEDDFDRFTASRNSAEDRLPPPVHVSEAMPGYEDLDANGTWDETPDYGWVWAPRVAAGWAPYREGRWAWVEPWGWTWIDDTPWGFAPFHYGRWASVNARWVWVPGARTVRPVYAPALVVFAGGGRIGSGLVGWFPLGPREVYRPAHTASARYLREVNIAQVTNLNVTNATYVNQRSVTVVPPAAFTGARRVHEVAQQIDGSETRALGSAPPVAPERQSVLVSARAGAQPRGNIASRAVVARTPAPAPPVSFDARHRVLMGNGGRPLEPEQVDDLRRQTPGAAVSRPPVRVSRPIDSPAPTRDDRPTRRIAPMAPPQPAAPAVAPEPARPQPEFRPRQQERIAPQPRPVPADVPRPAPPRAEPERPPRGETRNDARKAAREERRAEKAEKQEEKKP